VAVTFKDVITRVEQQLLGYTKDQASVSQLVQPMTSTDTTFSVDTETVTNLSRGLVQIGDEMILVKKYDRTSGVVTVMGGLNGRGALSTTPASHSTDDLVEDDPRFPKARIREAINDTIIGTYPDLWVFGEYEFPKFAARYEYPIPDAAEDVYKVTANTIGPSGVWFPCQSWRFNPVASTGSQTKPTPTPTGKSLQVYDFIVPGRNIRVSYTMPPTLLSADTDLFTSTGYPDRYVDMITYGSCYRLLPAYEAGRLQQQNIEATERAPLVPTSAASDTVKFFYSLYNQRLTEERTRLQRLFDSYQSFNG